MLIRDAGSRFINASAFSHKQARAFCQDAGKNPNHLDNISVPLSQISSKDVLRIEPLTWFQDACCILLLGCVGPTAVIILPLVTLLVGYFVVGNVALAFRLLAVLLAPFLFYPQRFSPQALQSWMTHLCFKYFSYRMIWARDTQLLIQQDVGPLVQASATARPQIFVCPPHGIYPYGTVLSLLFWPVLTGHHFFGLSATAALWVPLFGQVLRAIGCIDAGRQHATHALQHFPYTIGLSSGGVAEVFESNTTTTTNASAGGDENECILLRERIGVIKLAIRTGADLVPCYVFGNTKLLSGWLGQGIPNGRQALEWFSRRVLGFAAIGIFGRFLVPIPYRKPVLCVIGRAIPTWHLQCEHPTVDQVQQVQSLLIQGMQGTFDEHKSLYGLSENAKLIIK